MITTRTIPATIHAPDGETAEVEVTITMEHGPKLYDWWLTFVGPEPAIAGEGMCQVHLEDGRKGTFFGTGRGQFKGTGNLE